MQSLLNISAEGTTGDGYSGPPPEDDPNFTGVLMRSQGLLTLAFGFALGVTFMLLFWFVATFGSPTGAVQQFLSQVNPNLWLSFAIGFLGGTVLAGIYNLLTVRQLNIFGLESSLD